MRTVGSGDRLVIGSRGSMLAMAQTELIAAELRRRHSALDVTIKTIATRGDATQSIDRPPADIGGKGLFTRELELALADGQIDLAVHSAKDLPTTLADGTDLLAWPKREDARDGLVIGPDPLAPGSLATIPMGATVGTSSLRRAGQILSLRPDLKIEPIRGNIETRIRKVRSGRFAATLLAVAGLRRAGLLHELSAVLPIEQMVPAAGQGALALQGRAGDERVRTLLGVLDDGPTGRAMQAERLVVARLGGGCNMPLGCHVHAEDSRLHGIAVLVAPAGSPRIEALADADDPGELAGKLVDRLMSGGGGGIISLPAG